MMRHVFSTTMVIFGLLGSFSAAVAAESKVPEPFRDSDPDSRYAISYDDLTALLKTVVVDVGISGRNVAEPAPDITGTRMKTKVKKTANEGNRFYFEAFEDDEDVRAYLRNIQTSLEQLPSEAPLEYFSRDEQLAYWLNLYNVTVLNEIISIYPKRNIKKLVDGGKGSIFSKKLLTVAGVPLSLNDIQFTILRENYDGNPLILYGLYQGIIGGPSIRKTAYTGSDVYRALENNAYEFINSNRGTYVRDEKTFRVSSFYERNKPYFPKFNPDLTEHLLQFLSEPEKGALQSASNIKSDIDDWTITDIGGSRARIGGSFADSRAALLDSVKGTTPMDPVAGGGVMAAAVGHGSSEMAAKGKRISRVDPALLQILHEIDDKRMDENRRSATVTVDDLEEAPVQQDSDATLQEDR